MSRGVPVMPSPNTNSKLVLQKMQRREIPPKIMLMAVEGFGKTTCGAYAENPLILMAPGETGYETLLAAGLVPSVYAMRILDWNHLLLTLDQIFQDPQDVKTVVLDALSGFESMCHMYVTERDYGGRYNDSGFFSYQQGFEVAMRDWGIMLARLERLIDKGITVALLGHVKIRAFKNPDGPDYDRYVGDIHEKTTYFLSKKWADVVLFGNFVTRFDKAAKAEREGKGKAIGTVDRVVYSERRDAHDAKTRYEIPEKIVLSGRPEMFWNEIYIPIVNSMKKERNDSCRINKQITAPANTRES